VQKKSIGYTYFVLFCILFLGCKENKRGIINYSSLDTLNVDTSVFSHPIKISLDKSSLKYVKLQSGTNLIANHIKQLKIYNHTIYILDKYSNSIILFNISGKFQKRVSIKNAHFQCFDIYENAIYILEKNQSRIFKLDLEGKLVKVLNQDFHGVQFAALPKGKFIYNTGGLITRDADSENYQLSIPKKEIAELQLPFKPIYRGIKYFFENQFSRRNDQLFFTSAFENVIYKIDTNTITALTKFDFGKYNMPDSIFLKAKEFDNFNDFPYVSDLVNVANNSGFSFFKFSYHHCQGYLLIDARKRKIIEGGIGVVAESVTDFNNIVPICNYARNLLLLFLLTHG
jgi:hypothetical protein